MNVLSSVYTRTRKADVTDVAKRSAHVVSVPLTDQERRFYEAVFEHARAQARARSASGWVPGFAGMMRERQAASCIAAIRELPRHRARRASHATIHVEDSSAEVAPEEGRVEPRHAQRAAGARGGHGGGRELGPTDSKFDTFLEVLRGGASRGRGREGHRLQLLPADARVPGARAPRAADSTSS